MSKRQGVEPKTIATDIQGVNFPYFTRGQRVWTPLKNTGT